MNKRFVVNSIEKKKTSGGERDWFYFECYVKEEFSEDGLRRFVEIKDGVSNE